MVTQACINECEALNLASLDRMSLRIRPLYTNLKSTLLSLAGSKHSHTVPLDIGTRTKLLHHCHVLSMSNGTITHCFCNLSSSSEWLLWCICYSSGWGLGGAATLLHPQLEGTIKAPITIKASLNLLCILCFINLLAPLSACVFVLDLK